MNSIKNKKQIIYRAFKSTFNDRLWKSLGFLSFASFLSLVNLIWKIIETDNGIEILEYIALGFLGLVFLRFLWMLSKYIFIYIHERYIESKWGNAMLVIKESQSKLAHLVSSEYDLISAKKTIVEVLNMQRDWYNEFLKSNCGISIKVPTNDYTDLNNWVLKNICRDSSTYSRDNEIYKDIKHTVIHNTPFSYVIAKITSDSDSISYVNENIPQSKNYNNTSIKAYQNHILPYKSEIVSPIMIYKYKGNPKCLGFLCFDCSDANKFNTQVEYLVAFNEIFAETLYPVLDMIKSIDNGTES